MKHLGDITKIDGSTVTPVNVVIGGSLARTSPLRGTGQGWR